MALAFLNEWADLEVGTLITKRMPMILGPGQRVSVDLEFVLPANLQPLRHCHAKFQLYNATLSVDLYTSLDFHAKKLDNVDGDSVTIQANRMVRFLLPNQGIGVG